MPTNEDIIEEAGEVGMAAFDAAYMALVADATVDLASIRSAIAEAATAELLERRKFHGMGYMLQLAGDPSTSAVEAAVGRMTLQRRPLYANAARVALAAAARVLAEG